VHLSLILAFLVLSNAGFDVLYKIHNLKI